MQITPKPNLAFQNSIGIFPVSFSNTCSFHVQVATKQPIVDAEETGSSPCLGIQLIWHGDIHNIEPPPPPPPCRRGARKVPAFIRPADRMQPAAENWPLNVTGSLCVVRLLLCLSAACPGLGSPRLGSGPTLASMMALVGQFHPPLHCINVGSVSSQARHRYFSVPAERKMGHVVSWSEVATRSPESGPSSIKVGVILQCAGEWRQGVCIWRSGQRLFPQPWEQQ